MTIRHVTQADAGAWARMRAALWPGDSHLGEIAAFFAGDLPEPEAVFVAEHEPAMPIAVIELSIRRDLPGGEGAAAGYVEGLYVEPHYRATGITKQLLRKAQQWAFERGCTMFASDREDRLIIDRSFGLGLRDLPEENR